MTETIDPKTTYRLKRRTSHLQREPEMTDTQPDPGIERRDEIIRLAAAFGSKHAISRANPIAGAFWFGTQDDDAPDKLSPGRCRYSWRSRRLHENRGIVRSITDFNFRGLPTETSIGDPIVHIDVTFALHYRRLDDAEYEATDEEFTVAACLNSVYHSWPFARAHIHATTGTMQTAPFVLPTITAMRIAEKLADAPSDTQPELVRELDDGEAEDPDAPGSDDTESS